MIPETPKTTEDLHVYITNGNQVTLEFGSGMSLVIGDTIRIVGIDGVHEITSPQEAKALGVAAIAWAKRKEGK